MTMWPPSTPRQREPTEPNYVIAAGVLTYMVDMGRSAEAHSMLPFLLVQQPQGPDCYDLAFTLGNTVLINKSKQAAKVQGGCNASIVHFSTV